MPEWTRIMEAIGLAQGPERAAGRTLLRQCWEATTDEDHAQRCVLAHYLADTEADTEAGLDAEIGWDERALAEHRSVRDEDLRALGIASARGFVPSLELNLADGYHRRGDVDLARLHLKRGRAAAAALHHDGYGAMIRGGLDALGQRLAESARQDTPTGANGPR